MTYLIKETTLEICQGRVTFSDFAGVEKELEEPARVNEDQTCHSSQQDCRVETTLNHTGFSVTQ